MASRITQETRVVVTGTGATGGAARVTQVARVIVADAGTPLTGGSARVTQVARVIIATRDLSSGGFMLKGLGS